MTLRRSILLSTFAFAAVCVVTLAGCARSCSCDAGAGAVPASAGVKHEITSDDGGRIVSATVGDTVAFSAAENPSTGYAWAAEFDSAVLEAGESSLAAETSGPAIVGAPGVRTMVFHVKAPGKTALALKLARSWEQNSAVEQFEVVVDARARQ